MTPKRGISALALFEVQVKVKIRYHSRYYLEVLRYLVAQRSEVKGIPIQIRHDLGSVGV